MQSERTSSIGRLIHEITGGRPYVFMLMPFRSRFQLFDKVRSVIQREVGLSCIRADDIPGAGFDLLEKIHVAIERAELVIAEISDKNPNVFYELGYAVGIQKQILLLAQSGMEIPSDLRGRELILHTEDRPGMEHIFPRELGAHVRQRLNSQVAVLRDMLEAERPQPVFIVASPRYPSFDSRITGQMRDRRTFGDNLGILGLLSAFGSIFGETSGVELVSGQYCSPKLPERDINLFLIGSQKVNPVVDQVLKQIQQGSSFRWSFDTAAGGKPEGDYPMCLYRCNGNSRSEVIGRKAVRTEGEIHVEDYGIIIRAPHQKHPGRLIMVIAGAHSLGTGAACVAATRSQLIRDIKLKGVDIADRECAFWVLVKGTASREDDLLDVDGVTIEEAGVFSKLRNCAASS